jgi:hypothetical protein
MEVAIADINDNRVVIGTFTLTGFPSSDSATELSQEVRLSLAGASQAGLNLAQIVRLELIPLSQSGRAWLLDAWGWRSGMMDPQILPALPRVDVPEVLALEGDGNSTHFVSIPFSGYGGGQIRFYVIDPTMEPPTVSAQLVNFISAGSATFTVQVPLVGDDVRRGNRTIYVQAKAVRNVYVGDAFGGVQVVEDDSL